MHIFAVGFANVSLSIVLQISAISSNAFFAQRRKHRSTSLTYLHAKRYHTTNCERSVLLSAHMCRAVELPFSPTALVLPTAPETESPALGHHCYPTLHPQSPNYPLRSSFPDAFLTTPCEMPRSFYGNRRAHGRADDRAVIVGVFLFSSVELKRPRLDIHDF